MAYTRKTAARKKATSKAPTGSKGAINPIEERRTNTEDLALAQLKVQNKRRVKAGDTPGGAGTFSPNNNAKFQ